MKHFFAQIRRLATQPQILSAALLSSLLFYSNSAMASDGSRHLGDMLCSITMNMMPDSNQGSGFGIASLITGLAYISGALAVGSGLLLLVKRFDSGGRDAQIHQPIARLVGGSALLSMPSFVKWLFRTFAIQQHGGGVYTITACSGGRIGDGGYEPISMNTGITLDGLMDNLVLNIRDPLTLALSVLAIIMGMVMVFRGLHKASKYGTDPKAYSVPSILANLAFGAILISTGSSLSIVIHTIFGHGNFLGATHNHNSIWYSEILWSRLSDDFVSMFDNADELGAFEASVTAALTFFQLIGFIAFIRGWLILRNHVEGTGQTPLAQGLTHIFGGALAINIYQVLILLDYTFGTGFIS